MLVLEAAITKFNTMADGSGRLQFDTQELTPDQFKEIGLVNKKHGVVVFKPGAEKLSEKEMEAIKKFDTSGLGDHKKKSKSQVLRAVLYRMWENDNEGFETHEDHYNHYMDTVTNHFKKKLPDDTSSNNRK